MNYKLKEAVTTAYDFCDKLDNTPFGFRQHGMTARKALELELLRYTLYIAGLDGKITEQEVQVIRDYLGIELSLTEANRVARKIAGDRKRTVAVPLILQRAVMLDNFMYDEGRSCDWYTVTEWLVSLYDAVGEEVITAKGYVLENEIRTYEYYYSLLDDYVKSKLKAVENRLD